MPDREIRVPLPSGGYKIVRFPEGTPDADIEMALSEGYTPPPTPGRGSGYSPANVGPNLASLKKGVIENAPTIAATGAALASDGLSLPIQAAIVGGSATGGQGLKDWLQKGIVDPTSAAWEGTKQAAMQYGGGKLAEGVVAAGPYLKDAGANLLTRIAKPTTTLLKNVGDEWGAFLPERAARMSREFLERGLPITKPAAVSAEIDVAEDALEKQIAGSTARGKTQPSVDFLEQAKDKAKYQSLPESDQAALASTLEEYERNPLLSKATRSKVSIPTGFVDQHGNPILTTKIERTGRKLLPTVTVQKLQKVKQGTYRSLGDKAYGEIGSASREGQKQLARGQARAIEAAEPKVAPLNKEIGKLIDLRDYAEEAGKRLGNVNPVGVTAQIALATKSPGMIPALFERPLLGEPLARSLYGVGKRIPTDVMNPAQLYRLMLLAQMQGDEEPPQ